MANPVWIYDGTTVAPEWVYQEGAPRMLKACQSNAPCRAEMAISMKAASVSRL